MSNSTNKTKSINKNKNLSNKTLALLVAVAMGISLFGTFLSLERLGILTQDITGFANAGTVTSTVSSTTEISLNYVTVALGSGNVNGSLGKTNCSIWTNVNSTYNAESTSGLEQSTLLAGTSSAACVGFQTPTTFEVQNTGNVVVNVTMNSSAGPNLMQGKSNTNHSYKYEIAEVGGASCSNSVTAFTNMPTANGSGDMICKHLDYSMSNHSFAVPIRFEIPPDIPVATHSDTVTFIAVAS